MKTLFLDVELAPLLATVWGLYNQNIGLPQLLGTSEVLTWCAKWRGVKGVLDGSLMRDGKKRMLRRVHRLMCEADEVVTWNGNSFDIKVLNKEFLLVGLTPPAPFKSVDLLQISRKRFRWASHKLDHVAQQLGVGKKVKNRGHELWLDCMNRKREAFDEMLEYNAVDAILLEGIYEKFQPWISGGVNRSIYEGKLCCPRCGSTKFQRRGTYLSHAGRYLRYQCGVEGCGKWFRSQENMVARIPRMLEVA